MRRRILSLIDFILIALSPVLALCLRDNLELSAERFELIETYVLFTALVGACSLLITGMHRGLWRYASLPDMLKVAGVVTATILVSLFLMFNFNRLERLPRSVPVIQWFVLVGALGGIRIMGRLLRDSRPLASWPAPKNRTGFVVQTRHVVVIGLSRVTELYLDAVREFAAERLSVVGILVDGEELRGRELKFQRILGAPDELLRILAQYETHGVVIDRVALTVPFQQLSRRARAVLRQAEGMGVELDFFAERLGIVSCNDTAPCAREASKAASFEVGCGRSYGFLKRCVDLIASATLVAALAPVACVVALIVALDVGWPIVFWQQRPGRYGKPFKLYKFRTMAPSRDASGARIPDELRSSCMGKLLRRTRLDELPQLYNILVGEMSFVGPRPLLATEQAGVGSQRLLVRPGLTGWAQINGGREVSIHEKTALDMWYVKRMSPKLDAMIVLGTVDMLINGDRRNASKVEAALEDLGSVVNSGLYARTGGRQAAA